jgi:hypothetical protein
VVMDFSALGRHLILDGVVTTVYMYSIVAKVAALSGFAAKQGEDTKYRDDQSSTYPVSAAHGGRHHCTRLCPLQSRMAA